MPNHDELNEHIACLQSQLAEANELSELLRREMALIALELERAGLIGRGAVCRLKTICTGVDPYGDEVVN